MPVLSNSLQLSDDTLLKKIYSIRGYKVMLDKDLAALYGVLAIRLREQVKRNMERFPPNFMFQLSEKEAEEMVSQNAIPSKQALGGSLPYVFTEHGVLMLASVLRSEKAMQVSIHIIDLFVKMREILTAHKDIFIELQKIEKKMTRHDNDIKILFQYLKKLINPPQEPRQRIGFRP